MMTDKEILAGAPDGATHVLIDIEYHPAYVKFDMKGRRYFWHYPSLNYWYEMGKIPDNDIHSLADIRALVEKDERIKELEKENASIKLRVKEIAVSQCADYPDVENQSVYGHLWAIEQSTLGVMQANEDVHAEWEKSKSAIAELEKERDEANCHAYYIMDTCTVFSPKNLQAHNLEQKSQCCYELIAETKLHHIKGNTYVLMRDVNNYGVSLGHKAEQLREGVK